MALGGEGEEDSEEVEEEGGDDANPQGEGASGGHRGQGEGVEEEEAIHRGGDEGDVGLQGGPRGDVRDHADVRLVQGGAVGVGRRSESVRVVVSVEVVGGAFLEVRGPRDAWQGEEPVVAAVEVAAAEKNLVVEFDREERRREEAEGDREGGEGEEKSDAAVVSLHPRWMKAVDQCLLLG